MIFQSLWEHAKAKADLDGKGLSHVNDDEVKVAASTVWLTIRSSTLKDNRDATCFIPRV